MKWGTVKDYICVCKNTTRAYELKTLAMLRDGGQDKLAEALGAALNGDRKGGSNSHPKRGASHNGMGGANQDDGDRGLGVMSDDEQG